MTIYNIIDPNNSTTNILTANSIFTGLSTDILLYSSISIAAYSDVSSSNNGFNIEFSTDNSNWDYSIKFTLIGGESLNHIIPATNRYYRIIYTNGGSNQTEFRLQTILNSEKSNILSLVSEGINYSNDDCCITNSISNAINESTNYISPLKTDNFGNLNVNLNSPCSEFGDIRVQNPIPVSQVDFVYGVNSNQLSSSISGSGSISSSNSLVSLSSGAATSSSATLSSKRYLKYKDGQGGLARFTGIFSSGVSGNTQIVGVGTANDGFFFGYNGNTFGVLYRSSSSGSTVNTWISQTSWNIDVMDGNGSINNKSNILLNPQNGNVYQITYSFLGFGNITFYVMSSTTGKFIKVHCFQYSNNNTLPLVSNPTFPLYWQSYNTTNNTNVILKSASGAQFNEGVIQYLGPKYAIDNSKSSTATYVAVFTIKNNTTINSITNYSNLIPKTLTVTGAPATLATAIYTFQCILNATLGGTPSYTNIDSVNSIASYDTAGTTISGGIVVFDLVCCQTDNNVIDLSVMNIILNPGDTLTIAAKSSSNGTAYATINWLEDI